MSYTELQVTSNFSFLRGGSHPEELVAHAAMLGYAHIIITDHNTLAGIVRAHVAAKKHGIKFLPACCLDLLDGPSLLAFLRNKDAYSRLSGLLTIGNIRADKGDCHLYRKDVFAHAEGIRFIVIPPADLGADFELPAQFIADIQDYRDNLSGQPERSNYIMIKNFLTEARL